MDELVEDYQRKINSVNELLKDKTNSEETINRLKTKVGCYRAFLVDVNRALNIDLVIKPTLTEIMAKGHEPKCNCQDCKLLRKSLNLIDL